MNQTIQRIEEINRNGFQFEFGDILEQTFQNFKKIAMMQGLVIFVVMLIFTVLIGSVAGLAIGLGTITEYFTDLEVNGMGPTASIINLIVSVIGAGLAAPFTAGLLKMAHLAEENKEFGFSTAFDYYKSSYFKELFLAGIYVSLFLNGIGTLLAILAESFSDVKIILNVCSIIFNVVASILTIFSLPLIVFGNLPAVEAIKASIPVAKAKFWIILILAIIMIICVCLSIFAFCIGIFFAFPLLYSLEYIMYRTAFGIYEKSELDEIGSIE